MPRLTLVLTQEADQDLDNLYVDGFKRWGKEQADQYYNALLDHFEANKGGKQENKKEQEEQGVNH